MGYTETVENPYADLKGTEWYAPYILQLTAAGIDTLIDDRKKVSAGVKFKDAELLGIPWLVVIGRGLKEGTVEVRCRATGERREIAVADAFQYVNDQVHQDLAAAYARAEKIVPAATAAGSEEE